jgi:glutathione peroxidase
MDIEGWGRRWRRAVIAASWCVASSAGVAAPACPALLDHVAPRLQDEKPVDLCSHAGKVVMVVNTASFCGFTSQYKSLEAVHARYRERGLVVLGFPSNDFGKQEPGSNAEIAEFCENTYGVRFPMFAKTTVRGPQANPLFASLAKATGVAPGWNFHKYLIGRDGVEVLSFGSSVDPQSRAVTREIERMLSAKYTYE